MFDWQGFLSLAEELSARKDEASKRTAISRAYYYTLNRARALLEREGTPVPDEGRAHQVIWNTLQEAGKARRRLGVTGKRLREYRRKADYDGVVEQIEKTTATAMALAKQMSTLLDEEWKRTTPND